MVIRVMNLIINYIITLCFHFQQRSEKTEKEKHIFFLWRYFFMLSQEMLTDIWSGKKYHKQDPIE